MAKASLNCQHANVYRAKCAATIVALLLAPVSFCHAVQRVTLSWDRNPEPDIARYVLYYGTESRSPTHSLAVGNVTNASVENLIEGMTYFFTVRAINRVGLESVPSNEVSYTVPDPAAHVLTVNSGSGGGNYVAGTIVKVHAEPAPPGKQFERWIDDWVILAHPMMATTTAIMPYQDVTITAAYSDLQHTHSPSLTAQAAATIWQAEK